MVDLSRSKSYRAVLRHRKTCQWWNDSYAISHRPVCFDCFGGGLNKFQDSLDKEFGQAFYIKDIQKLERELQSCLRHGDKEMRSNHKNVIKSVFHLFREGLL